MSDTEQRVRERAYQLWEAAGRPHVHNDEFWYRARQEIEAEIPPLGDGPDGAVDHPPGERGVEEPPPEAVDTGMPFDPPAEHPAPPSEQEAPSAGIAVPEVHPLEPEAAEATVPHEPAPAKPEARPTRPVATSAARKAAEVVEQSAATRRTRSGPTRGTPAKPGRK